MNFEIVFSVALGYVIGRGVISIFHMSLLFFGLLQPVKQSAKDEHSFGSSKGYIRN